jgi:hypothetical protein
VSLGKIKLIEECRWWVASWFWLTISLASAFLVSVGGFLVARVEEIQGPATLSSFAYCDFSYQSPTRLSRPAPKFGRAVAAKMGGIFGGCEVLWGWGDFSYQSPRRSFSYWATRQRPFRRPWESTPDRDPSGDRGTEAVEQKHTPRESCSALESWSRMKQQHVL